MIRDALTKACFFFNVQVFLNAHMYKTHTTNTEKNPFHVILCRERVFNDNNYNYSNDPYELRWYKYCYCIITVCFSFLLVDSLHFINLYGNILEVPVVLFIYQLVQILHYLKKFLLGKKEAWQDFLLHKLARDDKLTICR